MGTNLNILMFGWELPPENSGGLGVACQGLSKALSQRGANITFVVPRKKESMEKPFFSLVPAGVEYQKKVEFDSPLTPYLDLDDYDSKVKKKQGIYGEDIYEEVERYKQCGRKIASQEKVDVIHAHDWLSFGAAVEAKKATNKPLVVHVHATEFDRSGQQGVDQRVYDREKEGMQMADKVVAVSSYTKDIIVDKYSIPKDKVEVAHNGVEFNFDDLGGKTLKSLQEQGKKIVLFVGRITIQKGPDHFLKAAKEVVEHNKEVIFIMAGSGDMKRQIIKESAQLGISDKMIFPGFVRGERLHSLYKTADLFVMPSVSEPFGLTPLESLVNGTPVLVSNQSGVSEVLDHALKVDFWDTKEMANQILTTLAHDSLRKTLKERGEKEVETITWDEAADKCINIYQSLI